MRLAGLALFAIAFGLNTTTQANGKLFDLTYRADQPSLRILALIADPRLPSRLEDFQPRPIATTPQAIPREPVVDLWERVREGIALTDLENPLVSQRETRYLKRSRLLKPMIDRSRCYIYLVVEELITRNMPTELVFLPMVGGGYNPMAPSSAQASGLWQFIPATGKTYKLEQTQFHDARRDVIASTSAALGDLETEALIGQLFQHGRGEPRDFDTARRHYEKAATNGDPVGQLFLGWLHQQGLGMERHYALAIDWYSRSAEQGNATAQNNIAYLYVEGLGVACDCTEAFVWYRKAAEQALPSPLFNIGFMFEAGRGTVRNIEGAFRYYHLAAEFGHVEATRILSKTGQ